MDQDEGGGTRKRKRKLKENAGAARKQRRGGEPQEKAVFALPAMVVGNVQPQQEIEEECFPEISEESIAQMMNWLALDLAMPAVDGTSAGYVTVQGTTAQSCGPSFSGTASTVMASVDLRFLSPVPPAVLWPWPEEEEEEVGPRPQEEEAVDDEWLAGILTDGPSEDYPGIGPAVRR